MPRKPISKPYKSSPKKPAKKSPVRQKPMPYSHGMTYDESRLREKLLKLEDDWNTHIRERSEIDKAIDSYTKMRDVLLDWRDNRTLPDGECIAVQFGQVIKNSLPENYVNVDVSETKFFLGKLIQACQTSIEEYLAKKVSMFCLCDDDDDDLDDEDEEGDEF